MDNNNKENASAQEAFQKAHDSGKHQSLENSIATKQNSEDLEKKQVQSMPNSSVSHQENLTNNNKEDSEQKSKIITEPTVEITDREGFELIDQQYQKEIKDIQRKITEKWNIEYMKKIYVGDKDMQAQAKAHDNDMLQKKINSELEPYKKRIETFHFGETGRTAVLEKLRKEALVKENNKQVQQNPKTELQKEQEQNELLREHKVKNIYELSRKIIKQQEMKQKKGRRR